MNYKKINNITGWVVLVLASLIYLLTMEASGSFWDCGEFASSAFKVQIPHPPGAPLFVLIGRVFMAFTNFIAGPHKAVLGINTMSALASGFTILFLFWSITHFAKKIFLKETEELSGEQTFIIMAAGVIGAFAYAFSDSFWYSAVESEVYALSSFFTAIVFWVALKWENAVTEEQKAGITGRFTKADRWLILIFYLMGLAIGVHLLNLLTIPSVVMIYYFKRYTPSVKGTIIAFLLGCVITGVVQKAVIQWTIKLAGNFDVLFVNNFGLPFFSGFAFFYLLLIAIIAYGLIYAKKKNWNFLKLGLWSFAVLMLGTTSYFTTMMRSNANPAVDMFKVDNPISLVGYLSRDQYGDWPIVYGQDFTAGAVAGNEYYPDVETEPINIKTKNGYEPKGHTQNVTYHPEDLHLFPRMWDASNDQGHADYYARYAGISKTDKGSWTDKPSMADNIGFFIAYQNNWMYWRYFLWNYAGKENDLQGINMLNVRDGDWKTGIGFWDQLRLGSDKYMPETLKHNKSNNNLYALPLILGLLGLFFQYKKDKNDTLVVFLLFFFTGLAIAIYLNMPGNQPRERDYAFAGSTYAFAFWIGLGVLYVKELFAKLMSSKMAGYAATLITLLAVPVLMGFVEWDDHDRGNKTIARDLAIDYLESCAPNAILITYGDNDTYPLWYAQEVEGIRRDVRVINQSLLGTDWYINELRNKINQSDPIDPLWTPDQIVGDTREVVYYSPMQGVDPNQYMDLYTMMHDYAGSDDESKIKHSDDGSMVNLFPTKKVSVPVDINTVRQNGTVNPDDSVLSELQFSLPKDRLFKNDLAILNMIAANKWKRPIYFTQNQVDLGFDQYLRQDGLTYRLVPVKNADVNRNWVMDKMINKFQFGNCDKPGVYYDEENRRHLISIRSSYAMAAMNLAQNGRKEDARKLLEFCDKHMLEENFPYGLVASRYQQHDRCSVQFLQACYAAGDSALAKKVGSKVKADLMQQMNYYASLGNISVQELQQDVMQSSQFKYQQEKDNLLSSMNWKLANLYDDAEGAFQLLGYIQQMENQFNPPPPAPSAAATPDSNQNK